MAYEIWVGGYDNECRIEESDEGEFATLDEAKAVIFWRVEEYFTSLKNWALEAVMKETEDSLHRGYLSTQAWKAR